MKRVILALTSAVVVLAAPLVGTATASADPKGYIWKCWYTRTNTFVIPKAEYYSCVNGMVYLQSTYDGSIIQPWLDGNCLNTVWVRNKSTTPETAFEKCKHGGSIPK